MWKLKREVLRLVTQLRELGTFARGHIDRWVYDLRAHRNVVITQGDVGATKDMAVVLVFQPDTLLASLFFQLEHLKSKGLSVVLVANHPVGPEQIARLKPHCHLIIQRPNVGYDFGGYREGILHVLDRGYKLDTLFVMNDSVWFPLRSDCTFIDTARNATPDMYGVFENTKNVRRLHHHHLQSYFYRFNAKILSDPRFRKRWKSMPFYQSKRLVIRRLEIKLSGLFKCYGYDIGTLIAAADVVEAGDTLSDGEVQQVAYFHATTTERGRQDFGALDALSPSDPKWPDARQRAIHDGGFAYHYIDAHPLVLFKYLNTPFLKKSREFQYAAQRDELIKGGFHHCFDPIIQGEVLAWNDLAPVHLPVGKGFPTLSERAAIWAARSSGKAS